MFLYSFRRFVRSAYAPLMLQLMLGTHHKIIGPISPLPTILGNVPIILVVLKIILSDFPEVWGVVSVTESVQKNVEGAPIATCWTFMIRNPAVGGALRTNARLSCRLSRETKQYPIRKLADRRRKHNKHMSWHYMTLSLQFLPAITKDWDFAITLKPYISSLNNL